MKTRFCFVALCLWMIGCQAVLADTVSLSSLLDEMIDRAALARLPEPAYACKQASSYERDSKSPDRPGWFANRDWSHFLRKEVNDGRTEWVMMDAKGPGAIVRWWVTGKKYMGTIRVYLDGEKKPTIEMRPEELLGGKGLVRAPLSAQFMRGRNLHLPIPYAKSCKVTYDHNFHVTKDWAHRFYYQINYRTYSPGAAVETFSMAGLKAARKKIAKVQKTLLNPASVMPKDARTRKESLRLTAGQSRRIDIEKTGAICRLSVKLDAKDRTQALRSTVLGIEFDGENTVWCPVGDFFGSGVGVNPFKDWYREVDRDGVMTCWWVMPFKKECELTLKNLSEQTVSASVALATCPWSWDDRSMHFHSNWRAERDIETGKRGSKALDWNYLRAEGQGVYVGDTLALRNRSKSWWGEGDEKIYVDGESFPSHFGTGTEDYYGYAWGKWTVFTAPFHAQPRAEGPRNAGHITNTRVRSLDAIPFDKSFVLDMEIWHWKKTKVDYAVATYWYGRPGAEAEQGPMPEEAKKRVRYKTAKRKNSK